MAQCSECGDGPSGPHRCNRSKTIKRLKATIYAMSDLLVRRVQMDKKDIELEIGTDGIIRTAYRDDIQKLADDMGGEMKTVCRAAHVEWETINGLSGWTIRAAHDPTLHVRDVGSSEPELICTRDTSYGQVALFTNREMAIEYEQKFFFKLLPPKESR